MDEGHPPTTDHLPGTRRVALVQYQPSVKGDNLCTNIISALIEPILIIKLILLLVHFTREIPLSGVEFNAESDSDI